MSNESNKNPFPDDLTGQVVCGNLTLSGLGVAIDTLPDIRCKYIMLSNLTVTATGAAKPGVTSTAAAGSGTSGREMYWGFNGKRFAQLFTGERTELIRVNNANQINVEGNDVIYFACFK